MQINIINKKKLLIEKELKASEWIPLKVILEEWEITDIRYRDYLNKRLTLRTSHAKLEEQKQQLLIELNNLE